MPRHASAPDGFGKSALIATQIASDEAGLLAVAQRLAERGASVSAARVAASVDTSLAAVIAAIRGGGDPLGEALCAIRSTRDRRARGQVFTPPPLVDHMVALAATALAPNACAAVIDCGAGTARFLRRAAAVFPNARLVAIESDPDCALIARANLTADGLMDRADIVVADFRAAALPDLGPGPRLFIGNPPYVRHHAIPEPWKAWYAASITSQGLPRPSKLAGTHLHFFARVAELARLGDVGVFVTAAEWLDTGYGAALRGLLLGPLGGRSVTTIDATTAPFPGTLSTAAITTFTPRQPVDGLTLGEATAVDTLETTPGRWHGVDDPALTNGRWSVLTRAGADHPAHTGRVGDLFRVSRGQVTGCNAAFVVGPRTPPLPDQFKRACVTGAEQIFAAPRGRLSDTAAVGRVVSLPRRLDTLSARDRRQVDAFLDWAKELGADASYTARHRAPWWRVALGDPAPIIMSYMARRAPAIVRNDIGAGVINVAHGLWPRVAMTADELDRARAALAEAVSGAVGRVYAGGLVKFEPRAMEAVPIDWDAAGLGHLLPVKAAP